MKLKGIMCGAVLSLVGFTVQANAAPVFGILDLSGSVTVTPSTITWNPPAPMAGYGEALIGTDSTGTFAALANQSVYEFNLNAGAFPPGPIGSFAPLDNFEILETLPNINFVLESILTCTALGGGVCPAPAGPNSPFVFVQNSLGTTVTLGMTGIVYDTDTPELVSTWTGIWTAQFTGQTIADVLTDFADGEISTTYSASKITVRRPIPEPVTMLLFGLGLTGVAYRARRRS